MKYYIIENDRKEGPYDLISMLRKIRNGSLTSNTMVLTEGTKDPVPAMEINKLQEVFQEMEESANTTDHLVLRQHSLMVTLKSGWHFFQANQITTVYTGLLILAIITTTAIFHFLFVQVFPIIGYLFAAIAGYFYLSIYLFFILRMNRGQPTDINLLKNIVRSQFKPLLIVSCIIAVTAMIGAFLLIIPGLFILTLYIFTPLLIIDHKMPFWDAMETSRKLVLGSGTDNLGIIFALVVINFVGGLLVFLPLLITLPVTISCLCEMYDELFNA